MSSSENSLPGRRSAYSAGWTRSEGTVTFGNNFSNYLVSRQDRILVIPLSRVYQSSSSSSEYRIRPQLCHRCLSTIDPEHSVGTLDRFPCVVSLRPYSLLKLASGTDDVPRFDVQCTCPDTDHFVTRTHTFRNPDTRPILKLVFL
jgi:hypothetical protein